MAISYFTSIGSCVSVPLTDSQDYDLVVEHNSKLYKVQVKTTRHKGKSGYYTATLRSCGGNRSRDNFKKFNKSNSDLLFILTADNKMYVMPSISVFVTNAITLNKDKEKYKVELGVCSTNW